MTDVKHGYFYNTYKAKNIAFGPATFECAENTVKDLRKHSTTSDRPGMLLGKVQSGKTRTFISIMALAFDNDYHIAIVLSKNSTALIEQTLKRLGSEFADFVQDGELDMYDIMHAPSSFGAFELDSRLIFAAKKQGDNLDRLIALFKNSPAMAAKRVLIVDDEADSASVGYAQKDGLIKAKAIATQVNELRSSIQASSYLQVTATPYSLYLQPKDVVVANVMEFKPIRPAFTQLVPVPSTYVGGETYFGPAARSQEDTLDSLIHHVVDHGEFDRLKKEDRRSVKIEEALVSPKIDGYRTALVNFIVGGLIQRINGAAEGKKLRTLRYSLLLHSEAGRHAHDWQEDLTHAIIDQLTEAAKHNAPVFIELVTAAHKDLSRSLKLAGEPVPYLAVITAETKQALLDEYVSVTKVNSDDDVAAMLDNSGQLKLRSPLSIFLGGQVLDRGVTLANLIGFYYGRRPNKYQQDTVLQHSRMYGYRRADLAVTRFYTSGAIWHAMARMEEFDVSLRAAIAEGGDKGVQFIRKAEDGKIVPCSPNKILLATTQTIRPYTRLLPIGFQTYHRTGANGIGKPIARLDERVEELVGFGKQKPVLIKVEEAIDLLDQVAKTMEFPEDDAPPFDWDAAKAALTHLSNLPSDPKKKGKVYLWAAQDRNSARLAGESSHATYIETPDTE